MTLAVVGVVLNVVGLFCLAGLGDYPGEALACVGVFDAVSVIGLIVAASGSKKVGAWMVGGGAIPHIPLGLIAIFGAKKIHDNAGMQEMDMMDDELADPALDDGMSGGAGAGGGGMSAGPAGQRGGGPAGQQSGGSAGPQGGGPPGQQGAGTGGDADSDAPSQSDGEDYSKEW